MDGYYGHLDGRGGNTRRRAPPPTITQAYPGPSMMGLYVGADMSLDAHSPALAPLIKSPAYQYFRGYHHVFPYQSSFHHTGAGNGYLPQQQSEPQYSTSSEQIAWQADTQSFAAASSSISTSSDHRDLQPPQMIDSSREQFHSLLSSTISRRGSLQHRPDEADPRLSLIPDGQFDSSCGPRDRCVDPSVLQLTGHLQSQDETEPWSPFNSRDRVPDRGHSDQGQGAMSWVSDDLGPVSTALLSNIHGASIQLEHQEISEKAFNSDIENIVESLSNAQILGSNMQHMQASYGIDHPGNNISSDRVAFQYRLDRAETPQNAETDMAYGQQDNLLVYLSPGSRSPYRDPSSPSTDSSRISMTSFSESVVLYCSDPGCGETFHGNHRRGSLNRHMRRKHRGSPGDHPCAETHCGKTFNRSDSRLKHYRKHHPWLAGGPAVPRGPQGARSTGSPRRSAGRGAG